MARTLKPKAWLDRALLLIVIGLIVQLVCLYHVTPASFLIFAGLGVGLIGVGLILFAVAVVQARRQGSAGAPTEVDGGG